MPALRPLLAPLALALAGALWGMTFWLAKIALAELNFWHIVLFRFVIGTLALMPFAFFRRAPAQRLSLPLVLLTGVLTVPVSHSRIARSAFMISLQSSSSRSGMSMSWLTFGNPDVLMPITGNVAPVFHAQVLLRVALIIARKAV